MITHEQEQQLAARIDAWDPETADLPDEVALALDESPLLRARFDARFARWEDAPIPVPEELDARVLPVVRRGRRWPWVVVPSLLAAAALLVAIPAVLLAPRMGRDEAAPSFRGTVDRSRGITADPDGEMLEPLGYANALPDASRRTGEKQKVLGADELNELKQLETLGYVDGNADLQVPSVRSTDRGASGKIDGKGVVAGEIAVADVPIAGWDGFVDHGVNGWRDAAREPESTFAVDVDRGSWTFARRRLREGFLPDPASVRVEEFVNARTYAYPEPEEGPLTVQFEASPSPWNDARHLVRIGVRARHVQTRAPAHLTFLIDTSGSMASADRLYLVKSSLALLVRKLGDGDTVAIVTYAGSAGVALPPTSATEQARILAAIDRLESGGSTAMGQGIALAYALADDVRREGHTNRVIIASDGDANVGTVRTGTLSELIRGYADRGITLTTLGFGQGNYQDDRMEQLANDGDGNYFYVDGTEEASRIFGDELTSTLEVVAKDVKIQVDWNPDAVGRYRLLGYENRALANEAFRDDAVDAGEVGADHTVTALYAVELVPGMAGPIATVRLRAKAPGVESPATERTFTLPRGALQPSFEASSHDHRMAVATAAFAERLRASPYTAGVTYATIERIARAAASPAVAQDQELLELIRRAEVLDPELP